MLEHSFGTVLQHAFSEERTVWARKKVSAGEKGCRGDWNLHLVIPQEK